MRLTFDHVEIELLSDIGYLPPTPDWSIRPHAHQYFELHIVNDGRGTNKLDCGEFEMYPDIVYMAPPGEVHAQCADRNSPMSLYYFWFKLSFQNRPVVMPRIYSELHFVRKELQSIVCLQHSASVSSRFVLRLRIIELIWRVIQPVLSGMACLPSGLPALPESIKNYSAREVEKAIEYIHNHFLERPSVEQIAEVCHMSPRHLSRIFSRSMGISLKKYLEIERFRWVVSQLRNTSMPIYEISDLLHFSTAQYFSQWFKKLAGYTPLEFRRLHHEMKKVRS